MNVKSIWKISTIAVTMISLVALTPTMFAQASSTPGTISAIETALANLQTTVSALAKSVDTIAQLNQTVTAQQAIIDQQSAELTTANDAISALQSTVGTQGLTLGSHANEISALQGTESTNSAFVAGFGHPNIGSGSGGYGGSGNGMYMGQVWLFAGNFAPSGTHVCDGSLLPISQNAALFSLLGTLYGGNGTTTFALPNLQKYAPAGVSYVINLNGIFPSRN